MWEWNGLFGVRTPCEGEILSTFPGRSSGLPSLLWNWCSGSFLGKSVQEVVLTTQHHQHHGWRKGIAIPLPLPVVFIVCYRVNFMFVPRFSSIMDQSNRVQKSEMRHACHATWKRVSKRPWILTILTVSIISPL
jgi:hypothetical protein